MIDAVKPGGLILDLQVIRPDPQIELKGQLVGEIDGASLFARADAAVAALEARIRAGDLAEEDSYDHDVREHFPNGTQLVERFSTSKRRIPEELVPALAAIEEPIVVRERCRLRRLRCPRAQ